MARYETSARGTGIEEGLAARLHDPLWLLGRQWQFGEFTHENAASPAWIETSVESHPVDNWRFADVAGWTPYDPMAVPLERMVEQHGGGPTPRLRLEGGLRLRRMLTAADRRDDLDAFVKLCGFPEAELADRIDGQVRSRVPDGAALVATMRALADADRRSAAVASLREHGSVDSTPAQLGDTAANWLAWWKERVPPTIPEAQDAWDSTRLEHRFALRSTSLPGVELWATEYAGGRLDWSALDVVGDGEPAGGGAVGRPQKAIPAPARFGGMPATRLWEMEDARFDVGSVDAAPIDLGRLMLIAFATVYGNDWFVLPVRLPVGTLSRVERFVVNDVFGTTTELSAVAADQDGWNLFGLTRADRPLVVDQERPTSPWFLLTPSLSQSLESAPVDVVSLLRDEMANLAWAVESRIADDQGRSLDRFPKERPAASSPASPWPAYQVATAVPEHWFPLVPEQLDDFESMRLRLTALARLRDGERRDVEPAGTLLPPVGSLLHEEEVPRSGARVVRTWQHARWHDGSRHLWQGRHKTTGAGEGDSGLRYDHVEPPESPAP